MINDKDRLLGLDYWVKEWRAMAAIFNHAANVDNTGDTVNAQDRYQLLLSDYRAAIATGLFPKETI